MDNRPLFIVNRERILMKQKLFIVGLTLLLATLACNVSLPSNDVSTLPTAPFNPQVQSNNLPRTEDDVPRISLADAKSAFDSGQAIFVDTRNQESFAALHIKGAQSIPLIIFEENFNSLTLNKTDWIITYCT